MHIKPLRLLLQDKAVQSRQMQALQAELDCAKADRSSSQVQLQEVQSLRHQLEAANRSAAADHEV